MDCKDYGNGINQDDDSKNATDTVNDDSESVIDQEEDDSKNATDMVDDDENHDESGGGTDTDDDDYESVVDPAEDDNEKLCLCIESLLMESIVYSGMVVVIYILCMVINTRLLFIGMFSILFFLINN